VKSSSTTRVAGGAVIGILLVASVLVLATDLRVEHLGPVIFFSVTLATVAALLLVPVRKGS